MNICENWDTFCLNADIVQEHLSEEILIRFAEELYHSKEEQIQLAVRAQAGDMDALREFVASYVPVIVNEMKQYENMRPYSTEHLFCCYNKVHKYVTSHLFMENLEYDTQHYVPWMVLDEYRCYLTRKRGRQERERACSERMALLDEEYKVYMDSLPDKIFLSLEDGEIPSSEQELIVYLKERLSEHEMKVILVHYGILDGKTKTLKETAYYFGISRERIQWTERNAFKKLWKYKNRRRRKFLNY